MQHQFHTHSGFSVNPKTLAYLGLFFVVLVWGCAPLITLELYKYYSPAFKVFVGQVILLFVYLLMSVKHLKDFSWTYIKVGVPTGLFLALADISQKIGLVYTTPAKYAFLENLSCISVPVIMYILVRKKPAWTTVLSCLLCFGSVYMLNRVSSGEGASFGIGEILCALAGLLYGFNIAGTGAFAKKLYAPLYLAVQAAVGTVVAFVFSIVLNSVMITTEEGIRAAEKIVFSFRAEHVIPLILVTVISSALCWTIRTNAMKHIEASAVAVISPFSAVITAAVSVLAGKELLDINLIAGAVLGVAAVLLSRAEDGIFKKRTDVQAMQREKQIK